MVVLRCCGVVVVVVTQSNNKAPNHAMNDLQTGSNSPRNKRKNQECSNRFCPMLLEMQKNYSRGKSTKPEEISEHGKEVSTTMKLTRVPWAVQVHANGPNPGESTNREE